MTSDYCPDHGELMRAVGAIESSQKSLIEVL